MEIHVQELIDRIQSEGIATAQAKADACLAAAAAEANQRTATAKAEAEAILAAAREESKRLQAAGNAALQQAARNLLLGLRQEIAAQLDAVVLAEVRAALKPDTLERILPDLVAAWTKTNPAGGLELLVSEAQRDGIEAMVRGKLQAKLKTGLEIRPVAGLQAGIRIGPAGGGSHVDLSDQALAELLSAYLNPRLAALMKAAAAAGS